MNHVQHKALFGKQELLLLLLLLAAVTYNQVQPLQINYLATEFLPKLELRLNYFIFIIALIVSSTKIA